MSKVKKIVACVLFLMFMAYVPVFVFDKLKYVDQEPNGYSGILNLWHIETFEGGSGSRAEFLKKRAIEFESKNKGVLVSVQTYTQEQAVEKIANGDTFDMISFSYGVGCDVLSLLCAFEGKVNLRDDLVAGGVIDGKIFALPWAFGGYTLCAFDDVLTKTGGVLSLQNAFDFGYAKNDKNNTQVVSLGIGFAQYTNPFQLFADEGVVGDKTKWTNDLSVTPYQAYQGFLDKKFAVLLGSQRDLSRVLQKQSQGKLQDVTFAFLSGYTDLVQYISFCNNGEQRAEASQKFMEYITSDQSQKKLTGLQMFSPALDIFDSGLHFEMQKALGKKLSVPNVFADKTVLSNQKQNAMQKVGL